MTTSAAVTKEHLEQQYSIATNLITKLGKDLHFPFLEIKLYQRFFLNARDSEHLQATLFISNSMLEHKRLTLQTLSHISEREEVLQAIKQLAYRYSCKGVSTLDIQSQAFQLLFCLQQTTLRVIESVVAWRAGLTRPYPFMWKGQDYLLKVIADSQFIDICELSKVMPLQLTAHPLCSNLSSLALFGGGVKAGSGSARDSSVYPLRKKYLKETTDDSVRIQAAETVVYEEVGLQKNLMKELTRISASGAFLPLLDLSSIIPNCATGVRLTNKAWDHRFHLSVSKATSRLHNADVVRTAAVPPEEVNTI